MTWVVVVKLWAYQAYQLRIIVYTKTMRTIHGLELFSSANRQWIKGQGIEVKCTYPLAMMQFFTATAVHLDNSPGIYHDRTTMFQIHAPSNTSLTVVSQAASGKPEFLVLIIGR